MAIRPQQWDPTLLASLSLSVCLSLSVSVCLSVRPSLWLSGSLSLSLSRARALSLWHTSDGSVAMYGAQTDLPTRAGFRVEG